MSQWVRRIGIMGRFRPELFCSLFRRSTVYSTGKNGWLRLTKS